MDETRRFLRYVLPGTVLFVQLVVIDAVFAQRLLFTKLISMDEKRAILAVLGGVVAAGGTGFLLAQFYFTSVSWLRWVIPPVSHADTLGALRAQSGSASPALTASEPRLSLDTAKFRETRESWASFSAWWYMRSGSCRDLANAERRSQPLADLVHTCGAVLMTAIAGAALSLLVIWFKPEPCAASLFGLGRAGQTGTALLAWTLLFVVHLRNYRDVLSRFERFVHEVTLAHEQREHRCSPPSGKDSGQEVTARHQLPPLAPPAA